MIKYLLFDLDGTLLGMDQEEFVKHYFAGLTRTMVEHGYDPGELAGNIWKWVQSMYANDGSLSNEALFWNCAKETYGQKIMDDYPVFEQYYHNEFQNIARFCPPDQKKIDLIENLKRDYRLILATNPLFPSIATRSRLKWAGMNESDFELITTYEDFHYAKPNPAYFLEVLEKLGLDPKECVMIGNDVLKDGGALQAGIPLFLLDEFLINRNNLPLDHIPHGNIEDLYAWLEQMKD